MRRRVCLLLPASSDVWRLDNLRRGFEAVAKQLERDGWRATIAAPAASLELLERAGAKPTIARVLAAAAHPIPLLTGLSRESSGSALRASHELAQALWDMQFDLFVAPLGGGIAHGLLMARAAGEAFQGARVVVWCDDSSAQRVLDDAAQFEDVDALVADAMERTTLRLADGVLGTRRRRDAAAAGGAAQALPLQELLFPALDAPTAPAGSAARFGGEEIEEIVFVGHAVRRTGLPDFLDAVELLSAEGHLRNRSVTFLGPMRSRARGLSKDLLGVRAQGWDFRFAVVEAETPTAALERLAGPGTLAVMAAGASDNDAVVAELVARQRPLVLSRASPHAEVVEGVAVCGPGPAALHSGLATALTAGGSCSSRGERQDWAAGLAVHAPARARLPRLTDMGVRAAALLSGTGRPAGAQGGGLTVCIAHRDRPAMLREALDSMGSHPLVEAIVVDNASASPEAQVLLDELAARSGLRVVRLERPLQQRDAFNLAAREARTEHLAFFDDDNAFTEGGLEALRRGIETGAFDVLVSNLEIYDDDFARAPAGRTIFLGDAGTAGLFFNGFGDTSMAIRRSAFEQIGGFEVGATGPALDWVFLAKARARGLRIGVLQRPAVKYRRDLLDAERKWRKRDKEGALRSVLQAYEGAFDPELLARLAQGLVMGLI